MIDMAASTTDSRLVVAFQNNGYKVIYLTGRPRYEAEATRNLLDDVQQVRYWLLPRIWYLKKS